MHQQGLRYDLRDRCDDNPEEKILIERWETMISQNHEKGEEEKCKWNTKSKSNESRPRCAHDIFKMLLKT